MGNKVALITGATCGIGASFARHFSSKGYDLIITGHPNDKITLDTNKLEEKYNVSIKLILADFTNDQDVTHIENIIKECQNIDLLINNAGFGLGGPFFNKDIQCSINMIKVHIQAPVRFIYAVLPGMIARKQGIIIDVSSLSSIISVPRDPLYNGTKVFHNTFMKSLHVGLMNKGIKLQVLCPGLTRTDFHKRSGAVESEIRSRGAGFWMDPDEVVRISVRNLSKKNKVIVVPGFRNKALIFMYKLIPSFLYYRIAGLYLQ